LSAALLRSVWLSFRFDGEMAYLDLNGENPVDSIAT